jgi:hypothetical protein
MRIAPVFVAATLSLSLATARARADEARARELFQKGQAAYAHKEYAAAAEAFEAAYREAPLGPPLYNAGRAWEAAGEGARAADDYDAAIRAGGLDALQLSDASGRLRALEASLGSLEVTGPEGAAVTVAHKTRAPVPLHVHLTPGDHPVQATFADGSQASRTVTIAPGANRSLLMVPPAPLAPRPETAAPPPPPSSRKTYAIVAFGVAGAGVAAGIITGVVGLEANDQYNASGNTSRPLRDRALTMRTASDVAWIGGGVFAATGVALLLWSPSPSSAPASGSVTVRAFPAGASLAGSF